MHHVAVNTENCIFRDSSPQYGQKRKDKRPSGGADGPVSISTVFQFLEVRINQDVRYETSGAHGMCKKITLKQYGELAKAVKEAYENKVTITLQNELIDNL